MLKPALIVLSLMVFISCKRNGESNVVNGEQKESSSMVHTKQQAPRENVKTLDFKGFQPLLYKEDDKVHVINFWATWCRPCVEEIPQFVKVMHESSMEGEDIDVVFVSLDFAKDVESRLIPFAKKNGIFENVVILDDPRENEWIPKVDKDWSGAIPATVIYKGKHRRFYEKPFVYKELKKEIEYFKEL
ncbi:MAG: thioredoxin [Cytophagaceae bacterium]|nr:thioredoxin [Cytophagaceae bacterium]|tara:strand:+ start:3915 stop:4478 length:564 start_codon:yes stop_codon:yes gene_type:complete